MAQGQLVAGQLDTDSGEDSCTPTLPSAATAGNLIVVVVRTSAAGGVGVNTPTDFTAGPTESVTRGGIAMFAKIAAGGETSVSVSAASTASMGAIVLEYEGPFNTSTPWDQSASASSGNTQVGSITSGTTGTLSQADELVVACYGQIVTLNTTDSYTNSLVEETGGDFAFDLTNNAHLSVASKIVSATTAVESTATFSGNGRAKGAIWTFELGAGGTSATVTPAAISRSFTVEAPTVSGPRTVLPGAIERSFVLPASSVAQGNPGDIPDAAVIAFYDGRELAGSVTDQVSSWPDSGPNSENALAQATSSKQPTITESGFGGVRGVLFDGSDDALINSLGSTYSGDFAIMVAVELLTYPTNDADTLLSTGGLPDNKNLLGVDDNESPPGWVVMSGDGTQADHHHGTNDQTYLEDTPSRFVMTYLVENDNRVRLWENSVLVIDEAPGSGSGDLNDMGGMTLGCREDESRHTHCRVGALLLVDMAQTDVTGLLAARDDLMTVFGLSGGSSGSRTPNPIARAFTVGAVSPAGGAVTEPAVTSRSFTVDAVSVAGAAGPAPAVTARSVSVEAASPSGGAVTSPAVISESFTLPAVSAVPGGTSVSPSALTVTVAVPDTAQSGAAVTTPAQVGLSFTLPASTVDGGAVTSPQAVELSFLVPDVSIAAGGSGTASVAAIARSVLVNAVTVDGPGSVSPDTLSRVFQVQSVTVDGQAVVFPDDVAPVAALPAPTVAGGAVVTPGEVAANFALSQVSVVGAAGAEPGTVELTVTLPSVSLSNTNAGAATQEGELSVTFQEGGLSVTVQSARLVVGENTSDLKVSQ